MIRKLLLAGVFFCASVVQAYEWSQTQIDRAVAATTQIIVFADNAWWLNGAGVVINREGLTLTAAHVLRNFPEPFLMRVKNGNVYEMDILAIDTRRDLALLRPRRSAKAFQYLPIRWSNVFRRGEPIMVVGHPLTAVNDVQTGRAITVLFDSFYRDDVLIITALVRPGNSGGPVIDTRGRVAGIVSAFDNYEPGKFLYGVALAPDTVVNFLLRASYTKRALPSQIKRYRMADVEN